MLYISSSQQLCSEENVHIKDANQVFIIVISRLLSMFKVYQLCCSFCQLVYTSQPGFVTTVAIILRWQTVLHKKIHYETQSVAFKIGPSVIISAI